jgi:hypothetical protein
VAIGLAQVTFLAGIDETGYEVRTDEISARYGAVIIYVLFKT